MYIAATVYRTFEEDKKYFSYAFKYNKSHNIASILSGIDGLLHANVFPTKKEAKETVLAWNQSYKDNGTYLFGDSPVYW